MIQHLQSLFGGREPNRQSARQEFPWKPLEASQTLENLMESSHVRPQVIFKHSTSCGLSAMMLKRFENQWDQARDRADFYFLDLIRYRGVSNLVADRLNVWHQSPQVLLLEGGEVRLAASHGEIGDVVPGEGLKNPA
ncbi:bacillithiol system redox-active protein YtxJ [Robiginitalea marina]|uniref:Bacillithiol system redox-active protein YtxJ n=1 Tax=Robiginitalea marina TaxID=2954105 RepID=A0ABT1AVW1_9FLAO|nr:bacillithiol system redox-active protein YtxJ [Robiginitalea marina]MCO5723710.1 bacillithiol system redox-active protein YtxJ [Robiginitalea marina]